MEPVKLGGICAHLSRSIYVGFEPPKPVKLRGTGQLNQGLQDQSRYLVGALDVLRWTIEGAHHTLRQKDFWNDDHPQMLEIPFLER